MVITTEFDIGESVYLVGDDDQDRGIVTEIIVKYGGTIKYLVAFASTNYWCYDIELSREKTYVINKVKKNE